ncbi:unnamed protein product [Penicillium glandicola]
MGSTIAPTEVDVLIVGAGVVGLTLAHALQKIFERDESIDSRGNGWGITIHWARHALKNCIPESAYQALGTITVDQDMNKKDPGSYKFFNLGTLERKFAAAVDPERMRIRREGLRKLLVPGLPILWGVKIDNISPYPDSNGVCLSLPDGSEWRGKVLVGADGSGSSIRRYLCPDHADNIPLPLRFIGVIVMLSPEATDAITDVTDPLTFQGCHPVSGVYMFWCLVSTPQLNGSAGSLRPYYQAQVCVSWNPREGEGDVPATSAGKVARIKELCADMTAPIKKMVDSIPESSEAIGVKLQDWPCLDRDNRGGRVTLAGDSAHAMTMYRGEAANFGIVDAADLAEAIAAFTKDGVPQAQAIEDTSSSCVYGARRVS